MKFFTLLFLFHLSALSLGQRLTIKLPGGASLTLNGIEQGMSVKELRKSLVKAKHFHKNLQKLTIKKLLVVKDERVLNDDEKLNVFDTISLVEKKKIANNEGFFDFLLAYLTAKSHDEKNSIAKKVYTNKDLKPNEISIFEELELLRSESFNQFLIKAITKLEKNPETLFFWDDFASALPEDQAQILASLMRMKIK